VGILENAGSARRFTLGQRCLIGRHARCDLRIDDPRVSSEHASLYWIDGRWELRDLGSRNGTVVAGRRLEPGERAPLDEGATFALGGPEVTLALADASEPSAGARRQPDGLLRAAVHGLIALPDDDAPEITLFEDDEGRWIAESEGGARAVSDQEILVIGGAPWRLELPVVSAETWQAERRGPALETIALRLAVSRDEERVDVTVIHEGRETTLAPRAYHYLLVTLARSRLADADAPPEERGWIDREELCRMLATDRVRLNNDVFRLRRQLAALGIHGAADIVARRPDAGKLRLGIERVDVRPL
jgi:hypothetical protein